MNQPFNQDEAKKYLSERNSEENEKHEQERVHLLELAISALKEEFKGSNVEVFLVGSIVQPHRFTSQSDVDVVLKNFQGDRFAVWTRLEEKIGRTVEIILFEKCTFQEFVATQGLRVM